MKLTFFGAAGEVTGSKHLVEIGGKRILLDCGMHQGRRKEADEKNRAIFSIDPKTIDAIVLSHAHIDHSGLIPLFVKKGFKGKIFCTFATRDLAQLMLMDSAMIQTKDAEYINQKFKKRGMEAIPPLYTTDDVQEALTLFHGFTYNTSFEIFPNISLTFHDAGHVLGSSLIELEDLAEGKKLVFTGDLGRKGLPILRDPYQVPAADIFITEGTYGDRLHDSVDDMEGQLKKVIVETHARGGKVLIPSFALERTQEIIYLLHKLSGQNDIPHMPIFVDSPLSINITEIFKLHPECYDKDVYDEFLSNQVNPFGFEQLKNITSVEESKALNTYKGSCIIIASSGMCENGRIVHHLRNNIDDHRNSILIVGYQAEGTLGRKLVEKVNPVTIFAETHWVNAEVHILNAFSAHADKFELVEYAKNVKGIKHLFIVHAETSQAEKLKEHLTEAGVSPDIQIPQPHNEYEV